MRHRQRSLMPTAIRAVALAVALYASQALALDFGRLHVLSHQGEPLRAELDIDGADARDLDATRAIPATSDHYRDAGMRYSSLAGDLRATVKRRGGQAYIEIVSTQPVNSDFVDVLLNVSWPSGRAIRAISLLVPRAEAGGTLAGRAEPSVPLASPSPPPAPAPDALVSAPASPPPAAMIAGAPAPVAQARPVPAPKPGGKAAAAQAPAASKAAPAEPRPSVAAANQAAPAKDQANGHRVAAGESLGMVAGPMQADLGDVSLEQVLWALYRGNPQAFIDGNMNRLKAGVVMRTPTQAEVGAASPAQARREVRLHAAAFARYRAGLASTASPSEVSAGEPGRASSGEIGTGLRKSAPEAAGDRLQLTRPDAKAGERLREEQIARERQLHDAEARIAQLEKNVQDLRKLVDLLSKQGPGAAAGANGGLPVTGAAATASAVAAAPAAGPAEAAPVVTPAPAAAAPAAPAASPASEVASPPVASVKPTETWLTRLKALPLWMPAAAVGAVVTILLAWLVVLIVRRRRARALAAALPDDPFGDLDLELDPGDAPPPSDDATPVGAPAIDPRIASLSLDLGTPPAEATAPGVPQTAAAEVTGDDPLEVRLRLAEAYRKIGDDEGARMLFEDVVANSTGAQRERAARALAELG